MPSKKRPSDDAVNLYTNGQCDVFAIALNRVTDWEIRVLFSYDCEYDPYDESDEPKPVLLHAWVRRPDGTAIDARGTVAEDYLIEEYGDGAETETDAETITAKGLEDAVGKYHTELEDALRFIAAHKDFYLGRSD